VKLKVGDTNNRSFRFRRFDKKMSFSVCGGCHLIISKY